MTGGLSCHYQRQHSVISHAKTRLIGIKITSRHNLSRWYVLVRIQLPKNCFLINFLTIEQLAITTSGEKYSIGKNRQLKDYFRLNCGRKLMQTADNGRRSICGARRVRSFNEWATCLTWVSKSCGNWAPTNFWRKRPTAVGCREPSIKRVMRYLKEPLCTLSIYSQETVDRRSSQPTKYGGWVVPPPLHRPTIEVTVGCRNKATRVQI